MEVALLVTLQASVELRTLGYVFEAGDQGGIIVGCRGMSGHATWHFSGGAYHFTLASRPASTRKAATVDAAVDYTVGLSLPGSPLRAPAPFSGKTLQMAGVR